MKIHIHTAGRVITIDRKRRAQLRDAALDMMQDLVDRLLAALARQGHVTQDEDVGHQFHGNQYVDVAGQNVKVPTKGGVKSKTHELLSAGHKFSFEELLHVLGNPPKKALTDALATLKNPKWAGPKGALDIVKGADGKFHVVGKDGELAKLLDTPKPPLPSAEDWKTANLQAEAEAEWAAHQAAEAEANGDDPPLEWEPGMPEELKAHADITPESLSYAQAKDNHAKAVAFTGTKDIAQTAVGTGAPLTKEAADAHYKNDLDELLTNTQHASKTLSAEHEQDIALAFKQGKANAMAQWKAHTTGNDATAKKQEVFEADLDLVKNLAHGANPEEALAQWKKNTYLEKQGLFGTKLKAKKEEDAKAAAKAAEAFAAAPKVPPAPSTVGVPSEAQQPAFAKVPNYVPHDHVGITPADVSGNTGHSTPFYKQITALKGALENGHPDPVQNKKGVQAALTERLSKSPAFQHIKSLVSGGIYNSLEANLISQWAGSSGGNNSVSNAAQIAIRDAFGMSKEHVDTSALKVLNALGHDEDKVYQQAASNLGLDHTKPEHVTAFKAALHDFAIAQYENTQEHLKQLGITHVMVARGMTIKAQSGSDATEVNLKLQPASSFSANWSTAHNFASGGSVYYVKVPASQVLSSYVTGYGCSSEHEVVVLAHPKTQAIEQASSAATSLNSAMQHIGWTLPGAKKDQVPAAKSTAGPKPEFSAQDYEDLSPVGKSKIAEAESLYSAGHLSALKAMHAQHTALEGYKPIGSHMEELIAHLEKAQQLPKIKKPSAVFKPMAPPTPTSAGLKMSGTWSSKGYKAVKEMDHNAFAEAKANFEAMKASSGSPMLKVTKYYETLEKHLGEQMHASMQHKVQQTIAAMNKAAPKPATPAAGHPTVNYAPGVPSHHAAHPHFNPDQYKQWQAQGKSQAQIGKILAAIKFAHKKKAEATS